MQESLSTHWLSNGILMNFWGDFLRLVLLCIQAPILFLDYYYNGSTQGSLAVWVEVRC